MVIFWSTEKREPLSERINKSNHLHNSNIYSPAFSIPSKAHLINTYFPSPPSTITSIPPTRISTCPTLCTATPSLCFRSFKTSSPQISGEPASSLSMNETSSSSGLLRTPFLSVTGRYWPFPLTHRLRRENARLLPLSRQGPG